MFRLPPPIPTPDLSPIRLIVQRRGFSLDRDALEVDQFVACTLAASEILRLSADLLECADTDVAIFSCVLIHGPGGDRVVVHEASVWLGSDSQRVALVVT